MASDSFSVSFRLRGLRRHSRGRYDGSVHAIEMLLDVRFPWVKLPHS
jgi:hypothetical protein